MKKYKAIVNIPLGLNESARKQFSLPAYVKAVPGLQLCLDNNSLQLTVKRPSFSLDKKKAHGTHLRQAPID